MAIRSKISARRVRSRQWITRCLFDEQLKQSRARNATALLAGNQLVIHRKDREPASVRLPINDPDASLSLAVDGTLNSHSGNVYVAMALDSPPTPNSTNFNRNTVAMIYSSDNGMTFSAPMIEPMLPSPTG